VAAVAHTDHRDAVGAGAIASPAITWPSPSPPSTTTTAPASVTISMCRFAVHLPARSSSMYGATRITPWLSWPMRLASIR
jgi:hypothetical protein